MADQVSMRDKAIALAKQGFRVFPLKPNSKLPAVKKFHEVASSDPEAVAKLWSNGYSDCNIGISTDGLLVIDVDNKNGKQGVESFKKLQANGLTPLTVEARTPTGGQHLFYALPQGVKVQNSVDRLGPGVDVRSYHGYVVAPGSVVPAGEYKWTLPPGSEPLRAAIPPLIETAGFAAEREPAQQIEGFEPDRPAAIERAIDYLESTAPEAVETSGGDHTTYQVACQVKDFGISPETCLELMAEHWNEQKAFPPWTVEELEIKVENAYQYGKEPMGVASPEADFEPVELESSEPKAKPPGNRRLFGWTFTEARERSLKAGTAPLVKKYLLQKEMSVLYGDSNTGKTFVALDQDFHIAAGKEWNGRKVAQGPVVYVAAEAGPAIAARIEALARKYPEVKDVPLLIVPCLVDLFDPKAKDLKELIDLINEWGRKHGQPVQKVTLDTLARVIGAGDENSARDMGILVQNMDKIRVATGAHVMVVHHTGKVASKGARGSSALRAATDTELEVEGSTIWMRKQRNLEPAKAVRFKLTKVELGKDQDGDSVTSCVVEMGAAVDFEPQLTQAEDDLLGLMVAHAREEMKKFGAAQLMPVPVSVVYALSQDAHGLNARKMGEAEKRKEKDAHNRTLRNHISGLQSKGYIEKDTLGQIVLLSCGAHAEVE